GQRVQLTFANGAQPLVYYIKSVDANNRITLALSAADAFDGSKQALTVDELFAAVGANPGLVTATLLDLSVTGAQAGQDGVLILDDLRIVPDGSGGYRNLQDY